MTRPTLKIRRVTHFRIVWRGIAIKLKYHYQCTRAYRYQSASQGGLVGVAVVAVMDAASDNTRNDWRYPIARVVLERDDPARTRTR